MIQGKPKRDTSALQWSEDCKEAFAESIEVLSKMVILSHPAANAELVLTVDASDFAVGAELHQVVNGTSGTLGFFSCRLSDTEKRYSTYDRELLAIFMAVKHFRHLIEGAHCVIYTDHKPLTYAFKQQVDCCSPRQVRHLEFISQYCTDIR